MAALYLLVESEIFVGSLTTIIWAAADRLVNPIHFQYTAANKTDSNELGVELETKVHPKVRNHGEDP